MESFEYKGKTEIILLNLKPGDLIKESIEKTAREKNIRHGAVLCGISALKTASLHHIKHTKIPGDDHLYKIHQPMEMTSLQGVIVNYEAHCHMQCMSGMTGAIGGHLEDGAIVAYLAEIVIMNFCDMKLERYLHESGVMQFRIPKD